MSTIACNSLLSRVVLPFVVALGLVLGAASDADAAARTVELTGTLNLNTATESELRQLPGIGPAKAKRILELRAKKKFTSTQQLMNVKGIGKKTYRKLKANLSLTGETNLQRKTGPAKAAKGGAARAESDAEPKENTEDPEVEVIRAMPSASLDSAKARAEKRLTLAVKRGE